MEDIKKDYDDDRYGWEASLTLTFLLYTRTNAPLAWWIILHAEIMQFKEANEEI